MGTKRALHERSPPGIDLVPASQRRRLSFSNSDLSDPRQLEVLYERCLDQVLRGIHPVSRDTAIRLAAVHCFVQYGPYREGIENSIRAYNLLPKEYVHAREHEKNIAEQYRNLVFPDGVAARRKYCDICKNLPTYGMIFFEVKEPDGNKLVPRLFGVNKDCVMSVDKKTKVVRKSWPLEQLRRWAASPVTFNIDFGDYQDGYFSVLTPEGERIKRLIAEFVDIILIKKQIVDPFGLEGDEGAIMIEDYVLRGQSVPLEFGDGPRRLGSPIELPPFEKQQQPPLSPEPRSPFVPLENQFPAHEFRPQRPVQPTPLEQQPMLAQPQDRFPRTSAPPLGTEAPPPAFPPPFQQQPMPQPARQRPDQYDQLPFQLFQQPQTPSPPAHAPPPMPYPRTLLPLQQPQQPAQPLPQLPMAPTMPQVPVQQKPTAAPPPPPPQSQSLPPSLTTSTHQQLTSTSSASIAAFTSHEIAYEICYKQGVAHRSFQQHFQSSRNLQGLATSIDQSVRRLTQCRATLGQQQHGLMQLGQQEREEAIQLGEDTIRHRAVVFLACTAQAIEWTSEYQQPGPKYGHVQVAVSQAGDNLCELVQCVSELSALAGNPQFTAQVLSLVEALCEAFTNFLAKLHPDAAEKRSNFLTAASLVGESAFVLLNALNGVEDAVEDQQFYVALNEAIQAVANSTATLVLQAKSMPGLPGDSPNERVIQTATQVAIYTSELIALSRVLASIMAHPACQKRVQGAVERVRAATAELLAQAKSNAFGQFALTGSTEHYAKMQRNALEAEQALQQLVQQAMA